MIQLAWRFLRFQEDSALAQRFRGSAREQPMDAATRRVARGCIGGTHANYWSLTHNVARAVSEQAESQWVPESFGF
jgi:hypothetical protein